MIPKPLDLKDWKREFDGKWDKDCLGERRQIFILEKTFDDLKQRIKSACEFWLKYRNDPISFFTQHKKLVKRFKSEMIIDPTKITGHWELLKYNEWLFKLAFKCMLCGDKK